MLLFIYAITCSCWEAGEHQSHMPSPAAGAARRLGAESVAAQLALRRRARRRRLGSYTTVGTRAASPEQVSRIASPSLARRSMASRFTDCCCVTCLTQRRWPSSDCSECLWPVPPRCSPGLEHVSCFFEFTIALICFAFCSVVRFDVHSTLTAQWETSLHFELFI